MSVSQNYPSIKPSLSLDFANVKALDPRITFARASTATYYGTQTAKAEENLFTYSQEFDNAAWVNVRSTDTANADTAPDGTLTADAILQASGETAGGHIQRSSVSVVAGDYVVSIFAKPNGKNFIRIFESLLDGTNNTTWFNLSTGAVGTTDAGHTATITASNNGYYRCTIKFTVNAVRSGTIILGLADTDGSTTVADDTLGLYLWGAQFEQRSAVTAYTPTTTQPITNYIPVLQTASANVARFDHNPLTFESLGLLVEEQRTNLVTYSEDYSNAAWADQGTSTQTKNVLISPSGTQTGNEITSGNAGYNGVGQFVAITSSSNSYTGACYLKAGSVTSVRLRLRFTGGTTTDGNGFFNLSAGTATADGNRTVTITPVGNGWYRCTITGADNNTGNTSSQLFIYSNIQEGNWYAWGAQLEVGAFSTSYIPTVASQVTRSADSASMTGANFSEWFSNAEGTLYAEWNNIYQASGIYALADATFANAIYSFVSGGNLLVHRNRVSSTNLYNVTQAYLSDEYNKTALAYEANNYQGVNNGVAATAGVSGIVATVDRLTIGNSSTTPLNGHIRKLSYYPQRLSDVQLQGLTS